MSTKNGSKELHIFLINSYKIVIILKYPFREPEIVQPNSITYVSDSVLRSTRHHKGKYLLDNDRSRNNPQLYILYSVLDILDLSNHPHSDICLLHKRHGHYTKVDIYLKNIKRIYFRAEYLLILIFFSRQISNFWFFLVIPIKKGLKTKLLQIKIVTYFLEWLTPKKSLEVMAQIHLTFHASVQYHLATSPD